MLQCALEEVMSTKIYEVAVIGGGAAGQMALLRSVLNHLETLVFLGDPKTNKKSRATWVSEVDNIPGFFDKKRPISSTTREVTQFINKSEDLKSFLSVEKKKVESIQKNGDIFILNTTDGTSFQAKYVVLCTGTMDVQPLIQGSIDPILPYANRNDVLYCIRCDGHRTAGKNCAVIGEKAVSGWIAVMLKERYNLPHIYVLSHGKSFETSEELSQLLDLYQIPVREEEITDILGDPKDKGLEGFMLGEKKIDVTTAFVALGTMVYNDLAKQLGVTLNDREHLVTNEKGETSVSGFYAVGDLVAGKKKQIYTAWDMAVDALDDIDVKVRTEKRNKLLKETQGEQ